MSERKHCDRNAAELASEINAKKSKRLKRELQITFCYTSWRNGKTNLLDEKNIQISSASMFYCNQYIALVSALASTCTEFHFSLLEPKDVNKRLLSHWSTGISWLPQEMVIFDRRELTNSLSNVYKTQISSRNINDYIYISIICIEENVWMFICDSVRCFWFLCPFFLMPALVIGC